MIRFTMPLVLCLLACALVAVPVGADDPPKKLTDAERKELAAKLKKLNETGFNAYQGGKYADATKAFVDALEVARELYNKADFPDGHSDLATSLNCLAEVYRTQGKLAAAEPLLKDALDMYKRLFKGDHPHVATGLNNLALLYRAQEKPADAEPLYKDALEMRRRLFKGDHPDVAGSLNNLAVLYRAQGKLADAETLLKDALGMYRRLSKGDHADVAASLRNLAALYEAQGRLADAEPLLKDALDMYRRLLKGDHPHVAAGLNNLAELYRAQGKPADAEPPAKDALDMRKRLFKGDHPDVANSLNNLALLYGAQGKLADAEPPAKDALDMRKRLFKGDHPDVANSLNNLALLYGAQGKLADAEPLYKDALGMYRRLFKGDHPDVAQSLSNLAGLYRAQGKPADAEPLYKDALGMYRRLVVSFALNKTEGETLTLYARQPLTRDAFVSGAWAQSSGAEAVYPQLWADKGFIARAYDRRQLQARAAAADPRAATALAELTDARRRRAELLVAPATDDQATRDKRKESITTHEETIATRTRELKELLPASARTDKLDAATVTDLQKVLPADAAVVDYLRFVHFEYDPKKPGRAGETRTRRYLAFVVTRDKVAWVDLDTAAAIEPAVDAWLAAITSDKDIPAAAPAKVGELVWEKVRKELPAGTKTVYLCPDAALHKVPFAALPGDKPGTVLLEEYALAVIPHAPFLLDKLWPQDKPTGTPTGVLVVGAVKYDAAVAAAPARTTGGPLLTPGQKLGWGFLPNTVGEANGVTDAAGRKKLTATRIEGEKATTANVLAALPKAKVAHFATHGFFADASFRSAFQLDEKDFENRGGERVGRVALSPMLMTGLVFAGANNPQTPGRGIVTGEQLIDLDLSGLELAVLSACETGLGDVAGGQGTFGLQRAFHYAGATDVVCSLWKVPDAPTAALMSLFYTNLWDKGLPPIEALQRAQLELYKNPGKIPALAKGFRGVFEEVPRTGGEVDAQPAKDGKAHPLLWAAFTLSGPGR